MYPELFTIGDFTVSSFGAMVAAAFAVAFWISGAEFRRKGMSADLHERVFLFSLAGGIIGAKLLFLLENVSLGELLSRPLDHLLLRGGLTFYGGFFLALAAAFAATKRHGESFWKVLDASAPALALAYAVGRGGCFLVGDDYGVASDLPWAMSFPLGSPPVFETVHPTQLYEIMAMSLVFALLWRMRKAERPAGQLAGAYLALAGTERFLVEFIRTTTESPLPGLSVAQVMAVAIVAVGAAKYATSSGRKDGGGRRHVPHEETPDN